VAEKLAYRFVNEKARKKFRYELKEIEYWQKHPKVLNKTQKNRLFQNKRMIFDENSLSGGNPVTIPASHVVYKDLVSRLGLMNLSVDVSRWSSKKCSRATTSAAGP